MKNFLMILIALLVLLLAAGGDHANHMVEERIEIAKDNSGSEDADSPKHHEISSNIFNSVTNITHLVFHSDLIFEFELPEIAETKVHSVINTALNFTKHYRTLFEVIISPNAP